jgi:uncharacterized protein (DUF2249 family)
MNMTFTTASTTIDVRDIAPRERHPTLFSAFRALAVGDLLEIVNDHDPKPLHQQFQAEAPGSFSWDYLQSGPALWRVSIKKLTQSRAAGGCCGSCGGGH